MPASLLRQLRPDDITCPAGELKGSASCFCSIESGVIEGQINPATIENWCSGAYDACPTWRAEKERIAAGAKSFVDQRQDVRDNHQVMMEKRHLRERRLLRAQELLRSDSVEGRKFRRRLGLNEDLPRGIAAG